MIIGIVGSEAAKFTAIGKARARHKLTVMIAHPNVEEVVSGECHLGGIDIWAREITIEMGKKFTGFAPLTHSWAYGYMPRNLKIASHSQIVYCLTVNKLPEDFDDMTHSACYHCHTSAHVKSGGCWTVKQAINRFHKEGHIIVVDNTYGKREQ